MAAVAEDETVEMSRAEWDGLQARMDRLERAIGLAEAGPGGSQAVPGGDATTDRRGLLKHSALLAAGALAGGTALMAAQASPAAAASGDDLVLGAANHATSPTIAICSPVVTTGFAFSDDPDFLPSLPGLGDTTVPVVVCQATPGNIGVYATGSTGVEAAGVDYAVTATGGLAALRLTPNDRSVLIPPLDTVAHQAGELQVTGGLDACTLWFCTESGTPGQWCVIASPNSTSSYTPVSPRRAYDSRNGDGPLHTGEARVVDLGGLSLAGPGSVVVWAVNLTIANTVGSGFLQLFSAAQTPPFTSAINWFTSNQIAANMALTEADESGHVEVRAGGGGSTDFVIDVLGFHA